MTPWLVVALGAVAMAAFGFFVAHLFDSINDYANAWAAGSLEDSTPAKETDQSSL